MKKIIIMLLCAVLVSILAIPALAANEVQFTIEPSKTTAAPGEEITFSVKVSGGAQCSSLGYIPEYDKNVLEMVGGKCTAKGTSLADFSNSDGGILLYEKLTAADGEVFRFTMRAKANAEPGTVTVSGNVAARDSKGHLQVKLAAATLTVTGDSGESDTAPTEDKQPTQQTEGTSATEQPVTGDTPEQTEGKDIPEQTETTPAPGEDADATTQQDQTPDVPADQDVRQPLPRGNSTWWIWIIGAAAAAAVAVTVVLLIKKKKA